MSGRATQHPYLLSGGGPGGAGDGACPGLLLPSPARLSYRESGVAGSSEDQRFPARAGRQ